MALCHAAHPTVTTGLRTDPLTLQSALLCSDVHLSNAQPALTRAFVQWLHRHTVEAAVRPQALLILGDLFDAWVGDDVLQATSATSATADGQAPASTMTAELPCESAVAQALAAIARSGLSVMLMHGNRDFLLGAQFAAACGAQLLDDPCLLQIHNGPKMVIAHGDQLCTRDTDYQQFRLQVRNPQWQQHFLARPLAERLALAQQLRTKSEMEKEAKGLEITDITIADAELLVDRLGADMLLHGHTHRPGVSRLPNGKMRWVLPDWEVQDNGTLARGGGLWVDDKGVREVPA